MNVVMRCGWSFVGLMAIVLSAALAPSAVAIPASVDVTNVVAIQTYDLKKGDDQAYLLVTGIANGKEFSEQFPKDKPWTIGPKTPAASVKSPVTVWKGDLGDGEFALVSITLMQGKAADAAKIKEYLDKKAEAEKKVADRAKAKLTADEAKALSTNLVKAQQGVIKDIKKIFSRDKNTDHYGGLFNVVVWNIGGKIVKRVDPVGLTFGEHFGTEPKIYSKIKNTRPNVMVKDEATGEWSEQTVGPISDQNGLRVKMLETEVVKGGAEPENNVTDYLVEIQVKAADKVLGWDLGGEQTGPTEVHKYWEFAQ